MNGKKKQSRANRQLNKPGEPVVYGIERVDVTGDLQTGVIMMSFGEDSVRVHLDRDAAQHVMTLLGFWYVSTVPRNG